MSMKKIRIISKCLIFALVLSVLLVESISVLGYISLSSDYTISTVFNMNELKSSEMLMAKVSVTNNSKSSDPIMTIIALYNPGGSMINISHTSKSISIGTTEILSVGFKLPDDIAVTDVPMLTNTQFNGLTIIRTDCDKDLTGIGIDDIKIILSDNSILPTSQILSTVYDKEEKVLAVKIDASVFARITSEGTTIATEAFGKYRASKTASVRRTGEDASNGYITSSNLLRKIKCF